MFFSPPSHRFNRNQRDAFMAYLRALDDSVARVPSDCWTDFRVTATGPYVGRLETSRLRLTASAFRVICQRIGSSLFPFVVDCGGLGKNRTACRSRYSLPDAIDVYNRMLVRRWSDSLRGWRLFRCDDLLIECRSPDFRPLAHRTVITRAFESISDCVFSFALIDSGRMYTYLLDSKDSASPWQRGWCVGNTVGESGLFGWWPVRFRTESGVILPVPLRRVVRQTKYDPESSLDSVFGIDKSWFDCQKFGSDSLTMTELDRVLTVSEEPIPETVRLRYRDYLIRASGGCRKPVIPLVERPDLTLDKFFYFVLRDEEAKTYASNIKKSRYIFKLVKFLHEYRFGD